MNSLLSNVPNLDRNGRSVDVESKNSLKWCFSNDVLIKPTDKNLSTALVSTAWYEQKVSSFLLSNKGYALITEGEAHTFTQHTVKRIRDLCYDNSTTCEFNSGNLSWFLGSRLPPPHVEVDPTLGIHWYRKMTGKQWSYRCQFLMDCLRSIRPLGASGLLYHVIQLHKVLSANFCLSS